LVGVENLVKWDICNVEKAIKIATESPRKAMKMPHIQKGIKGNFLRWHWDRKQGKLNWKRLS
jgi:N-acetylglucosamine-6-phosphate deacetylase